MFYEIHTCNLLIYAVDYTCSYCNLLSTRSHPVCFLCLVVDVEPVKTSTVSTVTSKVEVPIKNDTASTSGSDKNIVAHGKNVTGAAPTETQKIVNKPTVVEKIEEVIVIHEQSIGASVVHHEVKSNRGAVVALGLGLAVTAVLLMFVGCRLRNMKRKLRRGRPMNSNEADYLINGMYL